MNKFHKNEELIFELIIDDLDSTISQEDKKILEEWREADVENEKTYQEFLNVQFSIDKLCSVHRDADASWNVLSDKLQGDVTINEPLVRKINFGMITKIAAVFLVMLSVGYYFLNQGKYATISIPENASVTRIVLPDETILNLNAGTKIRYNKENFNADRKLEILSGEAFIQVVKHEGVQFEVVAGAIEAQDIGTSFNVLKHNDDVSVVVEEGIVALKQQGTDRQLILTAGKIGSYNANTKTLIMAENANPNFKAWVNKNFTFEEMPLHAVAQELEKVYQVPVVVKGRMLNNRKFTVANLHYQTIDSALAVISASLQFKVIKDSGTYVLSDN
ncbi:transmembrane sensor [Pedobacter sp. UYP24]